jgi:hypothetical protein
MLLEVHLAQQKEALSTPECTCPLLTARSLLVQPGSFIASLQRTWADLVSWSIAAKALVIALALTHQGPDGRCHITSGEGASNSNYYKPI